MIYRALVCARQTGVSLNNSYFAARYLCVEYKPRSFAFMRVRIYVSTRSRIADRFYETVAAAAAPTTLLLPTTSVLAVRA